MAKMTVPNFNSVSYWVYGLVGPDRGIFYVGFTVNVAQRISAHRSGGGGCSSYAGVKRLKDAGWGFSHVIFGEFDNSVDAKRLERMLIGHLPGLVNSTAPQAMISDLLYPITKYDEDLLEHGLAEVGINPYGGYFIKVDESPEYVDERYDDLDLIESP